MKADAIAAREARAQAYATAKEDKQRALLLEDREAAGKSAAATYKITREDALEDAAREDAAKNARLEKRLSSDAEKYASSNAAKIEVAKLKAGSKKEQESKPVIKEIEVPTEDGVPVKKLVQVNEDGTYTTLNEKASVPAKEPAKPDVDFSKYPDLMKQRNAVMRARLAALENSGNPNFQSEVKAFERITGEKY
jgi:hypothetical protein